MAAQSALSLPIALGKIGSILSKIADNAESRIDCVRSTAWAAVESFSHHLTIAVKYPIEGLRLPTSAYTA